MGRRPVSGSYITPLTSAGVPVTEASGADTALTGRGVFTLAAGTYYFPLGGADANQIAAHMQWDAAIAFTARIEDTCLPESIVLDYADGSTDGSWIDEDPSSAFIGTVGSGAAVASGVLTVTAGAVGGAMYQLELSAARRTRIKVVVTTPGEFRMSAWGKE